MGDAGKARPHSLQEAEQVLQRHWKYPAFRAGQQEVVEAVLQRRDVLAILPTGGGKSICYQVPALLFEGLTLVVSPLIALMQDQVAGLSARNVKATFINSSLSAKEIEQRWTDAEFGRYRLLYLAPERLQSEVFLARAERLNVALLAVDEAHCISEWGHHFRPSYLQIAESYPLLNRPPVLAVTATATPEVRRDIAEHLQLRAPRTIVKGFDRPNLTWAIYHLENKKAKLLEIVEKVQGAGIVYAATRRHVQEWADFLLEQGIPAEAYHGGMNVITREAVQKRWLGGATRVIVATNAFGMGIDKPDVRFVVHVDVPATLEAYYQEAGRGGRDGKRSYAVLLYRHQDEQIQQSLIEESHPDARTVQQVYSAACSLAQIPLGAQPAGPFLLDAEAVAQVTNFSAGVIAAATEMLVREGYWQIKPASRHAGRIHFRQSAEVTRQYAARLKNEALAGFITTLLRSVHADAFTDWWELDIRALAGKTRVPRDRFLRGLAFLEQLELIDWRPTDAAAWVELTAPRTKAPPLDDLPVRRARRRAEAKLDAMLRYARSVSCRRHFLLTYFGEKRAARCGKCDICLGRHKAVVITPEDEPAIRHILTQVERNEPRATWFAPQSVHRHRVDGLVAWLVQEGYLKAADPLSGEFAITAKAREMMAQWQPRKAE